MVFGAACAAVAGSWIVAAILTVMAFVHLGIGLSMRSR